MEGKMAESPTKTAARVLPEWWEKYLVVEVHGQPVLVTFTRYGAGNTYHAHLAEHARREFGLAPGDLVVLGGGQICRLDDCEKVVLWDKSHGFGPAHTATVEWLVKEAMQAESCAEYSLEVADTVDDPSQVRRLRA